MSICRRFVCTRTPGKHLTKSGDLSVANLNKLPKPGSKGIEKLLLYCHPHRAVGILLCAVALVFQGDI